MESITKNRQSLDTLRAMVARAYGPDAVPDGETWVEELGHGWFNVVYKLTLADGRQVALKIAPPPDVEVMTYEHRAMRTELEALRLVSAHTGVPVPTVDYADLDHDLVDVDYFFMPYVAADNLGVVRDELGTSDLERYKAALGAANRELNTILGPAFGPITAPTYPTWRAAFTAMFDGVLDDGRRRGVELGRPYDEIRAVLTAHEHLLDEATEPRYVEWDLWDGNALVRDGEIVCIIDHERAFFGDPLIEVGFAGLLTSAFGDATAFARGYGRGPLTGPEEIRRQLYTLHLALIMTIETVYRGHTDPGQYDWARERVDEVMTALTRGRPTA
ncbi:phosphotransferase family protein [Promicromonospora soli]|uniref:Aminoglycoside phosphotransferase n=1 Tax=Promicromonospora soli TaxID=2035533 RepID=A0A919KXK1_9MICO|nr:aminoglycoside phosphotransferase family protein [Promicromonospora soli]GHH76975.1 aminoglycoside phosphotransferase [Promicromonospora soli]